MFSQSDMTDQERCFLKAIHKRLQSDNYIVLCVKPDGSPLPDGALRVYEQVNGWISKEDRVARSIVFIQHGLTKDSCLRFEDFNKQGECIDIRMITVGDFIKGWLSIPSARALPSERRRLRSIQVEQHLRAPRPADQTRGSLFQKLVERLTHG